MKGSPAGVPGPQRDGKAVQGLGHHGDHAAPHFRLARLVLRPLAESRPDPAVVVGGTTEVPQGDTLQVLLGPVGKEDDDHRQDGEEHHHLAVLARQAEGLEQMDHHPHAEQIGADGEQSDGALQGRLREVDVELQGPAAAQRDGGQDQGGEQHPGVEGELLGGPDPIEDGLGVDIDMDGEISAQPEEGELDLPAHPADGGPQGALEVGQNQRGRHDQAQVEEIAPGAERKGPAAGDVRQRDRQALVELSPGQQDQDRGQGGAQQEGGRPAAQEGSGVDPSVAQGEGQPGPGQQGEEEKAQLLPLEDPAGHGAPVTPKGGQLFAGEEKQPRRQPPAHGRPLLPDQDEPRHGEATHRGQDEENFGNAHLPQR